MNMRCDSQGFHGLARRQTTVGRAALAMVAQQRADGGWGGNPNLASDALSTGEALYALHESGSAAMNGSAYERGIRVPVANAAR